MSRLDFDIAYDMESLKCPYCDRNPLLEYEEFGDSNGDETTATCGNCEKPLDLQINYEFRIEKSEEPTNA